MLEGNVRPGPALLIGWKLIQDIARKKVVGEREMSAIWLSGSGYRRAEER